MRKLRERGIRLEGCRVGNQQKKRNLKDGKGKNECRRKGQRRQGNEARRAQLEGKPEYGENFMVLKMRRDCEKEERKRGMLKRMVKRQGAQGQQAVRLTRRSIMGGDVTGEESRTWTKLCLKSRERAGLCTVGRKKVGKSVKCSMKTLTREFCPLWPLLLLQYKSAFLNICPSRYHFARSICWKYRWV